DVVPLGGIVEVGVAIETRNVLMTAVAAQVVEEPEAIVLDGAADGDVGVPVLDQTRRLGDADAAQVVVEIARLRPRAGRAGERGAAERVAARFGNDVERRPAAIALAHAARDGDLDLLRVHEIVGKTRDAAAAECRPDVHPVNLDRAFLPAPAA